MLAVTTLRCDHMDDPLTVGPEPPWLSWRLESDQRDVTQASYRIRVTSSPRSDGSTEPADVWDTGPVDSSAQGVPYGGPPLTSLSQYYWSVEVTGHQGPTATPQRATSAANATSATSATARFETGPLEAPDWTARWIGLARPYDQHADFRPVPHFRREFDLDEQPTRARLYITAGGVYAARVNGAPVGPDQLAPGWTDFRQRVHFQGYDVTGRLKTGANVIGAVVADGWYCGGVGPFGNRNHYGDRPALLAQLVLWWPDRPPTTIETGEAWSASFGPILSADLLMGQSEDARRALGAWDRPGYRADGWQPASVVEGPAGRLRGQPCVPPRVVAELAPVGEHQSVPGSTVFDLGQNMVGHVRVRLRDLPAGTIVRIRHAEMLAPDGTLYTENLRAARATDTYVSAGASTETFEPAFTFHGFRYLEVTGLPSRSHLVEVTGVVVSSASTVTGDFECSHPMVNQLQSNIRWGLLGNFLDVPTDCPQRDERLGWMGDAEIFAAAACFNADVAAFYRKWLEDVRDAQVGEGGFTDVAPMVKLPEGIPLQAGAPGWGDAGVIVPWVAYQWYGDRRFIEAMYPSAAAWVDRLRKENPDLVWRVSRGFDFGDWLAVGAETPKEVLATAFFAHSAHLVTEMATVLDRASDAATYRTLAGDIAAAFRAAFVNPDGRVHGDTQTAYALALDFGLLTEEQRPLAAAHLASDVEARGGHLSTGFLGVGHLLAALSDHGHLDVAYRLLLQDGFPSWGYSIRHGATTIWERWDGWTEERGFQDPGMNSFNHYSFGSVGEWMYAVVGGLRPDPSGPGWSRLLVQPRPGGGITSARCRYESARGPAECRWTLEAGQLDVHVVIPAGSSALVRLPCDAGQTVSEGGQLLPSSELESGDGTVQLSIGSGRYHFTVEAPPPATTS